MAQGSCTRTPSAPRYANEVDPHRKCPICAYDAILWVLDVTFGEDANQVRKDHAAQNLFLFVKIVMTIVCKNTTDTAKATLRQKLNRVVSDNNNAEIPTDERPMIFEHDTPVLVGY